MNYKEDEIMTDAFAHIRETYGLHYAADPNGIQLTDLWHANDTLSIIAVGTAQKYLTRYGKKEGLNKKDLFKAIHYIVLALYHDHYAGQQQLETSDQGPPPSDEQQQIQAVPIDLDTYMRQFMKQYQERQDADSQ